MCGAGQESDPPGRGSAFVFDKPLSEARTGPDGHPEVRMGLWPPERPPGQRRRFGRARAPGLVLRRVELLDGRRAAMIEYRLDGKVVSHYVVPMEEDEARRPSVQEGGSPRAPPVVTWSVGSVEQALVGELSAERLLELAR